MAKSSFLPRRNKGYFGQKVTKTLFGNSPFSCRLHALVVQWIGHRPAESKIQVRFLSRAPKQNSTAFSKPEGGTREARPTDFPPFFQTNSEFLARWRALIFRRGGGSSQRFLWHRPFLQKGLNQKQFCLYFVRLLASFGKVRANHSACVKDCRFLLRATSSRITTFLFANDNLRGQLFGLNIH